MSTFQGSGTDYRGWSDRHPDGSYTATSWIVFLSLPLVPRSRDTFRIQARVARSSTSSTTTYAILRRERVRLTEVLRTYLVWWLLLPLPVYLAVVVSFRAPQAAPCLALVGCSVFALGVVPLARRHQRRLDAAVARD